MMLNETISWAFALSMCKLLGIDTTAFIVEVTFDEMLQEEGIESGEKE